MTNESDINEQEPIKFNLNTKWYSTQIQMYSDFRQKNKHHLIRLKAGNGIERIPQNFPKIKINENPI